MSIWQSLPFIIFEGCMVLVTLFAAVGFFSVGQIGFGVVYCVLSGLAFAAASAIILMAVFP